MHNKVSPKTCLSRLPRASARFAEGEGGRLIERSEMRGAQRPRDKRLWLELSPERAKLQSERRAKSLGDVERRETFDGDLLVA